MNECREIVGKRNKVAFLAEGALEQLEGYDESPGVVLDLERSMERLSAVQREAIQMKYFLDYDYEMIAQLANVLVGTAKSRVFTALRHVKKYLGGERDE